MSHPARKNPPSAKTSISISRRTFTAAALACGATLVASPARALAGGSDGILGGLTKLTGTDGVKDPLKASASAASSDSAANSPLDRLAILSDLQPYHSDTQPQIASYTVADDLSDVTNIADAYLSDEALALLKTNLFFVNTTYGGKEFFEVYEMNRYSLFPNFVTVDSLMHTYHLYFSYLLKNTERDHLTSLLVDLCSTMIATSAEQLETLRGSEWEAAAIRCNAFFVIGGRLLGLEATSPDDVAALSDAELALISAQSGVSVSPLTGLQEDYTQYIVRGYYADDPSLTQYFQAMMWFGRMNFQQSDEDLDRTALLITLALTDEALANWKTMYAVTTFFCGASDDSTYYEYRPLAEQAYGADVSVSDLVGDDASWKRFHELTATTPAPQINSVPVRDTGTEDDHVAENKGFRFMGQRFSIDEAIFQQLVYNKVGENSSGDDRMLPNALDVPAALGSDVALSILDGLGATDYSGYSDNMEALRESYQNATDTLWKASLYSEWLYTLQPLLARKADGYPTVMQSDVWLERDLQAYLGSYAELKHDTILYSKQIAVEMGGGGIDQRDDRGYVEPEPDVFGRLAALVDATSAGLASLSLLSDDDAYSLSLLSDLAGQLCTMANEELSGATLSDDEYELIRSFGGQIEHFWELVYQNDASSIGVELTSRNFPSAIVADVATDPNGNVLEVATGNVSEMFVIVPVDGTLRLASGPVYSFYQFPQPMAQRLTDTQWRQMMGIELDDAGSYEEPSVSPDSWTMDFSL